MDVKKGLAAIVGKWPGNETDEEIQAAIDAMVPVKQLREENAKLRDQLRWRSTESEVPDENEFCLVIVKNSAWPNVIRHSGTFPWSQSVITHWRPIGPLPGGE